MIENDLRVIRNINRSKGRSEKCVRNELFSKVLTQGTGTLCSAGYAQMSKIPCEPSPCASDDVSTLAPKMPERLPKIIQLLTSKVDDRYKPAVANAVFPPLATHLCNVRFNYTDNVEHEATLMNCLMAGTGEGRGKLDE